MVTYNATHQGSKGTLVVTFSDGDTATLQSTHPAYVETLTYLAATPFHEYDEDRLREMVNPAVRLGRLLQEIDPKFDFDLYTLSYDGFPLTGPLADLIKARIHNQDSDWERFARFAARLEQNPSFRARKELYSFVQRHGLTVLADGRFVGHKSVTTNGLSAHSGPNNFVNGVLYGKPGVSVQVPHYVGTVISKRRGDVDDSPSACSTGLHVGTLKYASDFSDVLLTVAVAPEDVVGGEMEAQKFRTSRYEVLGMNENQAEFVGGNYEIVDRSEEITAREMEFADKARVKSREHVWEDGQQAEYNSLPSVGRSLYDSVRTLLNKSHDAAYSAALEYFGTYEEFLARRDAERAAADAEQAEQDAAEAAKAEQARKDEEQRSIGTPVLDPGVIAAKPTMDEKVAVSPQLAADLRNPKMGHKPLARKWKDAGVTETSVRRWRKTNQVEVTTWTKVKDTLG